MKKILFVCTGNICRSSTAEAMLRNKLAAMNKVDAYLIDSAGTHGYHVGEPSDSRAIQAASKRGINMSKIRARQLISTDFDTFDYIVAMDKGHLSILNSTAKESQKKKISLFLDHSNQGFLDVPDPYYGDLKEFEDVLDILERGMSGLIQHVE